MKSDSAQDHADRLVGGNRTQERANDFVRRLAGSKPKDAQDQDKNHGRRRLSDDSREADKGPRKRKG